MRIRAVKPAALKMDFQKRRHAGKLCPICQKNRLTAIHEYPICTHCRRIFSNKEEILEALQGHEIIFDGDEINWQEKPQPTLTGQLDGQPWKAVFVFDHWSVAATQIGPTNAKLVRQCLETLTPLFVERLHLKERKSKIRRRMFFLGLGATLVTAVILRKKYVEAKAEAKKKDQE